VPMSRSPRARAYGNEAAANATWRGRHRCARVADIVRICDGTSMRVRPHRLRHAAITEALDLTRADLRTVQRFSRHADIRTISKYDDNRTDLGVR